jgi:caffeoyl-CoA O-methyltransferase
VSEYEALRRYTVVTDPLFEYMLACSTPEDEVLAEIGAQAEETGRPSFQVGADQGVLSGLLTGVMGARKALELGTFLGYSAICIARALPRDGLLITCELDPEMARAARANFERAGVAERIDLRLGSALETLEEIEEDGSFDLAFIDAEKTEYPDYYEACLRLLRPGGLMLFDNTFMYGRVLDGVAGDSAAVVDRFNRALPSDPRVEVAMTSIADGLTFVRKR